MFNPFPSFLEADINDKARLLYDFSNRKYCLLIGINLTFRGQEVKTLTCS